MGDDDTNLEENEVEPEVGDDGLNLPPYPRSRLKKWKAVPQIKPQGDSPGEMGMA